MFKKSPKIIKNKKILPYEDTIQLDYLSFRPRFLSKEDITNVDFPPSLALGKSQNLNESNENTYLLDLKVTCKRKQSLNNLCYSITLLSSKQKNSIKIITFNNEITKIGQNKFHLSSCINLYSAVSITDYKNNFFVFEVIDDKYKDFPLFESTRIKLTKDMTPEEAIFWKRKKDLNNLLIKSSPKVVSQAKNKSYLDLLESPRSLKIDDVDFSNLINNTDLSSLPSPKLFNSPNITSSFDFSKLLDIADTNKSPNSFSPLLTKNLSKKNEVKDKKRKTEKNPPTKKKKFKLNKD